MEAVLQVVGFFCVAMAFLSGVFLLAIQPVWGIIDAAVSPKLSSGAKVAIILPTILLFGPLVTFFYALLGSPSLVFKQMTVLSCVLFVLSVGGVLGIAALSSTAADDGTTDVTAIVDEPAHDF